MEGGIVKYGNIEPGRTPSLEKAQSGEKTAQDVIERLSSQDPRHRLAESVREFEATKRPQ